MSNDTPETRTIEEILEAKIAHMRAVKERRNLLVVDILGALRDLRPARYLNVTEIGGEPHTIGVETSEGFTYFISVEEA